MKKCNLFALDLMHLSTNELNEIKDLSDLKSHLKECKNCQKKLKKLIDVDVFTFLARPRSEKFKRGMAKLSERIKAESVRLRSPKSKPIPSAGSGVSKAEPLTDAKTEIISAAGKIYDFVKDYTNGDPTKKVAYPVIRDRTGYRDWPFYEAMSNLITNDKLTVDKGKENRPAYALLKPG